MSSFDDSHFETDRRMTWIGGTLIILLLIVTVIFVARSAIARTAIPTTPSPQQPHTPDYAVAAQRGEAV